MKPQITKFTLSLATILTLGVTTVQAENILLNGSFEEYTTIKENSKSKRVTFDNWNGGGKILLTGESAVDGEAKVVLDNNTKVNTLTQNVQTINGYSYTLSFSAYTSPVHIHSSDIEVIVDGKVVDTIQPTKTWADYNVTFVGTGEEQSIGFREVASQNNNHGAILDNVKLDVELGDVVSTSIELAQKYGVATQGAMPSYASGHNAQMGIDGDKSTYTYTNGDSRNNWYQVAMSANPSIEKLMIQSANYKPYRLAGAKVYLSSTPYGGNVEGMELVGTLKGDTSEQVINFDTPKKASYVVVKATDGNKLHIASLEVYGTLPTAPIVDKSAYNFSLVANAPKGTILGQVGAKDYQNKKLTYAIEGETPFAIDKNGVIRVAKKVNHNVVQNYSFKVNVSGGSESVSTDVNVQILNGLGVKVERWNGIGGGAVSDLLDNTHYQDAPDMTTVLTNLNQEKENKADNFGVRLTTTLSVKESGDYFFAIVGDDSTELRLDGKTIASKNGWGSYQDWGVSGKSAKIHLEAGDTHEIEAFMKEAGGAEHVSVAWRKAEEPTFTLISSEQLSLGKLDKEATKPFFDDNVSSVRIDHWQNKIEVIANKSAIDYQGDTLSYSIREDVPFSIDANGDIRVDGTLDKNRYRLTVIASDGTNRVTNKLIVKVAKRAIVKEPLKSNDEQPELTGYVPNIYNDGETLQVMVEGVSYDVTVNDDGTWTLDKGEIEEPLAIGSYNLTLVVGDEKILYRDYFEVTGHHVHKKTQSLIMPTIEDIYVEVLNSTVTMLKNGSLSRGTDVNISMVNSVPTIANNSYRKIGSLLGQYTNDEGQKVLTRLILSQPIEKYSVTTLSAFTHDSNMTIVPTANLFNINIGYAEKDNCEGVTRADRSHECIPNDDEKNVLTMYTSTYSRLFNSRYVVNLMKAWIDDGAYDEVDLSTYSGKARSYEIEGADIYEQFYSHLYRAVMPNQNTKLFVGRGKQYTGVGNNYGRWSTSIGDYTGTGWASIGSSIVKAEYNNSYEHYFHEMMHGVGFEHKAGQNEGMTYGWSTVVRLAMTKLYGLGEVPVANVPKYVFTANRLDDNHVQVTAYQTEEATQSDLTVEIFSSKGLTNDDVHVEQTADDAENQMTMVTKNRADARHFFRLYASDSDEVMTLIFAPEGIPFGM